jgi:hypothetical protein
MTSIFGASVAAGDGFLNNSLVNMILVLAGVVIFLKLCGWARRFSFSAGMKKVVYVLTGVGLIAFNLFYSLGNTIIEARGIFRGATWALAAALIWVIFFALVLVAETKPPKK